MRAPISIVIPTLNSQNTVRKTLASLFEGIEAGIVRELIVVDGGSTDETRGIVEECGGKFISSAASRGYQLKKGVNLAKGDFIFVLHSDSVLEPGWSEIVKKYNTDPCIFKCDLQKLNEDSAIEINKIINENYSGIDAVIFNAAALDKMSHIESYDLATWEKILKINLTSIFLIAKNLIPMLKESSNPRIIFTTSSVCLLYTSDAADE